MPDNYPPDSLPILTETADGSPLDLPILTEAIEDQLFSTMPPTLLNDAQCHQLAGLLLPQIEMTLLDAINSTPDANWQTAMQEVRTALPEIIRKALREFH